MQGAGARRRDNYGDIFLVAFDMLDFGFVSCVTPPDAAVGAGAPLGSTSAWQ